MDGEGIPTVDSSPSMEIIEVESPSNEAPVLHSPPPSEDDAHSLQDLRANIIKQVEYYFSDENLPNDKFLMKQVKKDKEGFVSLSLVASFRKMKKLTKDSSLITDALKESSQLVVSSDGKKIKRLHPLHPKEHKDPELCTVVVANLPEDHSVQNIQKIFGLAGSIKTISIHDPRATKDSLKRNKAEKLVGSKMYALVEYESVEAAETAVATLNDKMDWRNGLWVQHLQKRTRKSRRRLDSEKGSHVRVPVSEDEDDHPSNEQRDGVLGDEDREHKSKEKNGRKGRNQSKVQNHRGNNGMGHGMADSSKPPPGPRMPDGTRGFTMGRGRPPMSCNI